jgi:hypothetical protein
VLELRRVLAGELLDACLSGDRRCYARAMRHIILGFDSAYGRYLIATNPENRLVRGEFAPQEVVAVATRTQLPVRPIRFMVSDLSMGLIAHRMNLGLYAQTASADPFPLDGFATRGDLLPIVTAAWEAAQKKGEGLTIKIERGTELLRNHELVLPVVDVGVEIGFHIENVSDRPRRFLALMVCEVIERAHAVVDWPSEPRDS